MPPSQLKRLKASLREQGIAGPQKPKKQRKHQRNNADIRLHRASALAHIREASNPFDFKHLPRPHKHDYTTLNPQDAKKAPLGRPGVTKSQGEETRRKTLLLEMNRRNKVGGILDRRIGEGDPEMSLEDRIVARFEQEMQRKRGNTFDLEEPEDDVKLTHGGQALRFDEDYDAKSVESLSEDNGGGVLRKKRKRDDVDEGDMVKQFEEERERKKSRKEVMEEVVAKSKQYKYERQLQKENDDELREKLDRGLPDTLAALRDSVTKDIPLGAPKEEKCSISLHPDRLALLSRKSRDQANREYDKKLKEMLYDQRSKPKDRTKTDQEKAEEEAERLQDLEEQRNRRMRGEIGSETYSEGKASGEEHDFSDDAGEFGLSQPVRRGTRPEGVEDEDDFFTEDIAGISEEDTSESGLGDESEVDEDFLKDVLHEASDRPEKVINGTLTLGLSTTSSKLPYAFPCPRTHAQLLKVLENVPVEDTPTVVQRIRAIYHASLHEDNKIRLVDFACILIDHVSFMASQQPAAPLSVIETVIRHIHSLAKTYPIAVATHFRKHLKDLHASNEMSPGALTILAAIGSIYPTSDHFHQVVTPAATLIARWLGLKFPSSTTDIITGAFLGALLVKYVNLSKRYYPEVVRYSTLCLKSEHAAPELMNAHVKNILDFANLWQGTPAFAEIFQPVLAPLKALDQKSALTRFLVSLDAAKIRRCPQLLHSHRPRAIRTTIPKFEGEFDPNRHYDPDKERSETAKLRKEYKKEKKGALRELRKDTNFIAREKLREKKEKDRAYEEKFRKLVKEIQNEEGREKNTYEREKRASKRAR